MQYITFGRGVFYAVRADAIYMRLRESLETAVRRAGVSCEAVAGQ
jgi:hypothetical protein